MKVTETYKHAIRGFAGLAILTNSALAQPPDDPDMASVLPVADMKACIVNFDTGHTTTITTNDGSELVAYAGNVTCDRYPESFHESKRDIPNTAKLRSCTFSERQEGSPQWGGAQITIYEKAANPFYNGKSSDIQITYGAGANPVEIHVINVGTDNKIVSFEDIDEKKHARIVVTGMPIKPSTRTQDLIEKASQMRGECFGKPISYDNWYNPLSPYRSLHRHTVG